MNHFSVQNPLLSFPFFFFLLSSLHSLSVSLIWAVIYYTYVWKVFSVSPRSILVERVTC